MSEQLTQKQFDDIQTHSFAIMLQNMGQKMDGQFQLVVRDHIPQLLNEIVRQRKLFQHIANMECECPDMKGRDPGEQYLCAPCCARLEMNND